MNEDFDVIFVSLQSDIKNMVVFIQSQKFQILDLEKKLVTQTQNFDQLETKNDEV
jgi:hypothetical protein